MNRRGFMAALAALCVAGNVVSGAEPTTEDGCPGCTFCQEYEWVGTNTAGVYVRGDGRVITPAANWPLVCHHYEVSQRPVAVHHRLWRERMVKEGILRKSGTQYLRAR